MPYFIENIMRQNIRGTELYKANRLLNNHWNWMKDNKDKKIIIKEINLINFYGVNKNK
jgi:hypothetical protein